jgi:hypothetical protein
MNAIQIKIQAAKHLMERQEEDRREQEKGNFDLYSESNIKITDKKGRQVQLKQNYVQTQIDQKIIELQSQGIPPRLIILKSRQMGASTGIQGRMIWETTTKENRNGYIVSHEDESTKAIFQKSKYMYDNLPKELKPLQKASNAQELIFDKPLHYAGEEKGLHSKIEIKTAGNAGIGRSETRHYVHASEFAFWKGTGANAPDKQLSGILQSVPDDIDTWVIIESTANGMNAFYDLWQEALRGNNGFIPLFYPWYVHEEYQMSVEDDEIEQFINTMSEYEKWLYDEIKLSLERIKWWREVKRIKCNNDIDQMKQENPTTAEEAFIFSGKPVFNNDKVMKRIEVLRQTERRVKYGYFVFDWNNELYKDFIKVETIRFVETSPEDKRGIIRIYEEVQPNIYYVLGGDTKGEGRDSYAGTVINNITDVRAATLKMEVNNSKPYTWQMFCLGHYYNQALIGIEINFNTAPIEELERLRYSKQYVRERYDDFTGTYKKAFGWRTDGTTRPLIIDKEVSLVEENLGLFHDIETLQQMITFVEDDKGRPDAMAGKHDDLLFSDMIAQEIRTQQRCYVVEQFNPRIVGIADDAKEDFNSASEEEKKRLIEKWNISQDTKVVAKVNGMTIAKKNGKRVYI